MTSSHIPLDALARLGLRPGDRVRHRRSERRRWTEMTVIGLGSDGSVSARDGKNAVRSLPVERLELWLPAHGQGRDRGRWVSLAEHVATPEQRNLF